jgi:hypothetical protein
MLGKENDIWQSKISTHHLRRIIRVPFHQIIVQQDHYMTENKQHFYKIQRFFNNLLTIPYPHAGLRPPSTAELTLRETIQIDIVHPHCSTRVKDHEDFWPE